MSDERLAVEPVRWDVPAIDGGRENGYVTAGRLEAIQQDAFDEAWKSGFEAGEKAGESAVRERVERLDQLLIALARPFDELDDQVEKQLVDLAMTVARQLFRREIGREPAHVIGVVREAVRMLPIASRNVQVLLHPDDAAIAREHLAPADGEPAWSIVEDPLMGKGGCRVTSENSQVDATAEARLKALIQRIVGDERSSE